MKHYSVMLQKSIELLDVKADGVYIDGTLGRGGHSEAILERLSSGKLYAFDLDTQAIKESQERLKKYNNVVYIHDNFANIKKHIPEAVDGIILDLGVSSPQFDEAQRGFSYRFDVPLDMRMNQEQSLDAWTIVNTYDQKQLAYILNVYGEERFASSIARKIVANRPINTTFELVDVIKQALPAKVLNKKGHPCKQSFQALRIATNGELDALEKFLNDFDEILKPEGRVAIITFHSLEDRIVKKRFKDLSTVHVDKRIAYRPEEIKSAPYRLLNNKVIEADEVELNENRRSQSAKLRGIVKG